MEASKSAGDAHDPQVSTSGPPAPAVDTSSFRIAQLKVKVEKLEGHLAGAKAALAAEVRAQKGN
jgi:hypothetical protein